MGFQQMQDRARSVRSRYALTLADAYDVDLVGAFTSTMDELDAVLAED